MSMKKTATGFAQRLKTLRESAGMTQQELADAAGLNRHGLAKLEQGVSEPHWPTVIVLAKALGVNCQEFMVEEADRALVEGEPSPRGRPRKDAPPATPSTPPADDLEAEEASGSGADREVKVRKQAAEEMKAHKPAKRRKAKGE